jgi:hypothetical protein
MNLLALKQCGKEKNRLESIIQNLKLGSLVVVAFEKS